MGIVDIFSKRQRQKRGELPDVYVYDALPKPLRVQVVHIVTDALGTDELHGHYEVAELYRRLRDLLAREYGIFGFGMAREPKTDLLNFFLETDDIERAL